MKNEAIWRPTKYVERRGKLVASRDPEEVGVGSRLVADSVARRYAEYLPLYARGHLVDLGCGKVPLYGTYKSLVETVTCVDWANSLHPNPHLDVSTNLSEPLPFPPARFDTVVLSDVLEHIAEPNALWDEMVRILAPGGHVVLNVPFLYGIHESPHDYYRYTTFALRRFAEVRGLRVIVLEEVGGSLDVLCDLIAKHLGVLPLVGSFLARAVQALAAAVGETAAGRSLARKTASFPLGYFMVAVKPPGG